MKSGAFLASYHTWLLLRFIYVAHLPSNANLASLPSCTACQCGQPAKQPRLTQIRSSDAAASELQDITVKAPCVTTIRVLWNF